MKLGIVAGSSGAAILIGLIIYGEIDRAVRAWAWRRRERRKQGVMDLEGRKIGA